ncbi:MAG: 2-oxoacid:acceptor oxidoreductase subunit alpha [Clostridiales bacterium]|jgi:2-oxoglutarate ferredoxin oxidoreductase subunit alpha|nr:2-oxoacid:acceptor oxidoreductase subunit alpha [Clostridiales bacterium]
MKLLMGNEACVEGAIAAGMRFFAGYPITPSTEIAEESARRLPMVGGKFIQMEDEIAGMAACIGASIAGVKSMTATSGPGFSLKQENIGYAAMTEIPCVIVNVQRSGPSTGLPTSPSQADVMQARWGTHGDHPVIALAPSSVRESFDVAVRAFNLAEKYRTPVIILLDEIIGHLREGIEIPEPSSLDIIDRKKPAVPSSEFKAYKVPEGEIVPPMPAFGDGYRFNITGLIHDETGFPTNSNAIAAVMAERRMRKVDDNKDDIIQFEEQDVKGCDILVVTYGGTARSVMAAKKIAAEKGVKLGIFRPVTIWPFPEEALKACVKDNGIKEVVVAELNYGQLSYEVERVLGGAAKVSHLGKIDGDVLYPNEIVDYCVSRGEAVKNG